jgi:hypothetical protein
MVVAAKPDGVVAQSPAALMRYTGSRLSIPPLLQPQGPPVSDRCAALVIMECIRLCVCRLTIVSGAVPQCMLTALACATGPGASRTELADGPATDAPAHPVGPATRQGTESPQGTAVTTSAN